MRLVKTFFLLLVLCLIAALCFSVIKDRRSTAPTDDPTDTGTTEKEKNDPYKVRAGFCTDFSDMAFGFKADGKKPLRHMVWGTLPSVIQYDSEYGLTEIEKEELKFTCINSGKPPISPCFKFTPLTEGDGGIYIKDFTVLTVDFDIEHDVDIDSNYFNRLSVAGMFDVISDATGATVSDTEDFRFLDEGHYTFMYCNTGDISSSRIFIFYEGYYEGQISGFLHGQDNIEGLKLSSFDILLPRTNWDEVKVDNVEFYIFEKTHDGELDELMNTPDIDLLSTRFGAGFSKWYNEENKGG